MTVYIELPLWLLAFGGGYLLLSLAISVRVYFDQGTSRPWKLSNWASAIATAPLVLLELVIQQWALEQVMKRRRKR